MFVLATAILALCPGYDINHKDQVVTTACQEWMVNCVINKAGTNEPTQKEFDSCASRHRDKLRSGHKIIPSELSEE